MQYRTLNPASGELLESFPLAGDIEIEEALATGMAAFRAWRGMPFARRAEPLRRLADVFESRAGELARLMALEMGKPVAEGEAEARKCSLGCRHYAEHAPAYLARREVPTDASASWVSHEPLGLLLAIMPWNYPFWQFYRFAAPALMAGNTVVLKHAPNTPRCARKIVELGREAGFPEGTVRSLFLDNEQAARVIGDPRVRGVTLTGSTRAGREVAAVAGRHLKPAVLELGGSDPFLVLDDADLSQAARAAADARCQNSGQSCIAAKRMLVDRSVCDEFTERLCAEMTARRVGDPLDPEVRIGPLAREDLRARLAEQVTRTLDGGARALCGGSVPSGPGFFYPPTVLADPAVGTPARDEELFGPVASVIPVAGEAEAVSLANATRYGLGASVWTRDPDRARRVVGELEAGNTFANGIVRSDPRLPFGGVKDSGFGRELAREGALAFVNTKTVWIA